MGAAVAAGRVGAVVIAGDGHDIRVAAAVKAVMAQKAREIGEHSVPRRAAPRLLCQSHQIRAGLFAVHDPAPAGQRLEAAAREADGKPYVRSGAGEAVDFRVNVRGGRRRQRGEDRLAEVKMGDQIWHGTPSKCNHS